jgi:site-specific DNA recombinase
MADTPIRRCAVYTRKSSEEGLAQDFNSLHAQREACEAFVKSQAGEGWRLIKTAYDDGGFSGGTMERPALQRMLEDIRHGLTEVVVVYKVDRLTRSLADFARIVELFDAHGVSFVAVTQQFNTTTSMGRLTLNVLLSFAQFEREVIGERIRDKVAASKRKGIWMGGTLPMGYDLRERKLVVNRDEARMVRQIFELYLGLGSVRRLNRSSTAGELFPGLRYQGLASAEAESHSRAERSTICSPTPSTSARSATSSSVIPDSMSRS